MGSRLDALQKQTEMGWAERLFFKYRLANSSGKSKSGAGSSCGARGCDMDTKHPTLDFLNVFLTGDTGASHLAGVPCPLSGSPFWEWHLVSTYCLQLGAGNREEGAGAFTLGNSQSGGGGLAVS